MLGPGVPIIETHRRLTCLPPRPTLRVVNLQVPSMRTYWLRSEGNRTEFELRELPIPAPGPGQILLRVRATSLNYGDVFARIGLHSASAPRPAGLDASGTVEASGSGVTGFRIGDRVMGRMRGAFSEFAVADIAQIVPIPAHLDWIKAAAIPIAFVTAWEALFQFGALRSGESVLIAGASSGVGVAAVQCAHAIGARVIATSRSAKKLARLEQLGARVVIQSGVGDYSPAVLAANEGKGVDLAVDLVGGSAFPTCQRSLADFGRLGVVGYVDGQMRAEIDIESLHGKRLKIFGVSNTPLNAAQRAESMRGFVRDVLPAISDGRIDPVVDRVFGIDELAVAKEYMSGDALLGKVVISVSDD